uniref:Very-long-chain aldehyde decarbonylase CER1-like C-terminal domain-containing protein n=1 Tax=Aegilops tauschii TaxID=37682 RepID=M8B148_AEGTA
MNQKNEYDMLKLRVLESSTAYLKFSSDEIPQIWIGDIIDDKQQRRAPSRTIFIPTSQFPLKKTRKDCTYLSTPAMKIPETMQNVHACENWLPRRVMSAWRIAGIIHAQEGWNMHECGDDMMDIEKIEDMSRTKQSVENHVLDSHAKQGCANTHLRSKFSAAHAPSDILLNTANILTLNYARSD